MLKLIYLKIQMRAFFILNIIMLSCKNLKSLRSFKNKKQYGWFKIHKYFLYNGVFIR